MNLAPQSILDGYIKTHSIPHAVAFIGTDQKLMLELAKSFVKKIWIKEGAHSHSIDKLEHDTHPDFHLLSPISKTGVYTIEQIKQVCSQGMLFPHEAHKQFFILKDAERMQEAAANALLKTLEEPESHSIYLLLVSEFDKLLPTLASRMQRIDCQLKETSALKNDQLLLQEFLDKLPDRSYNDLFLVCEAIQQELDKRLQDDGEDLKELFLDQECFSLLIQIQKWFQEKGILIGKVSFQAFDKMLDQAKLALERSVKLSICLEHLLLAWIK